MTFSTLASPGVSLQGGGGSGGGGGGTPGGSNTQIQYNSSGTFAGASGLTTNGTELTIASGTKTADAPVLNMSQTWNNGATTFTGLKFNAAGSSDANSAAASLLMDLQVGGSSRFSVTKGGVGTFNGTVTATGWYAGTSSILQDGLYLNNAGFVGFGGSGSAGSIDARITRRGAANLRLGAADAAAPVAQTLSVQSVVTGTSNTAGANLTITGSQGTGTGAGGSIIFQVAPAGGTGNTPNGLVDALRVGLASGTNNGTAIYLGGQSFAGLIAYDPNSVGLRANGGAGINVGQGFVRIATSPLQWGVDFNNADVILNRDAANILALRNTTNAQAFRVYNTYTDDSNYERAFLVWSANVFNVGTSALGTGTARAFALSSANEIRFQPNNTLSWTMNTSGHLLAGADNTYDIGASGGNRPHNVHVGNDVQAAGNVIVAAGSLFRFTGRGSMWATADGVFQFSNNSASDFGRINFGGSTSSFPALKRSSTTLQARLADDSAFAGFASANMQAATAYTVATLPGTPSTGMIARVTDALAPTIGATVTGGGAAYALVNYNGANWTVIGI